MKETYLCFVCKAALTPRQARRQAICHECMHKLYTGKITQFDLLMKELEDDNAD